MTRMTNHSAENPKDWYIDSCASISITANKLELIDLKLLDTPVKVKVGDSAYLHAKGKSTKVFQVAGGELRLPTYLIPGICDNLIATYDLMTQGLEVKQSLEVGGMKIYRHGKLFIDTKLAGRLFQLMQRQSH